MTLVRADGPAPCPALQGPGNSPVDLAQEWAERPAVVYFLRHFG